TRGQHRRQADEPVGGRGRENDVADRVADSDGRDDRDVAGAETYGRAAHRYRCEDRDAGGDAEDERRPPEVGVAGGVHRREVEAETHRREKREPDPGGEPAPSLLVLL